MGNGQENMGKAVISEFRQIRYKPCFSKCDKINISVWLRNENSMQRITYMHWSKMTSYNEMQTLCITYALV